MDNIKYKVGDEVLFYWFDTIKVGIIKDIDSYGYIIIELETGSNFGIFHDKTLCLSNELSRKLYL